MSTSPAPDVIVQSVLGALTAAGIHPLVLRRPESKPPSAVGHRDRQLRLTVPRGNAKHALAILEPLPWRYSGERHGLMGAIPMAYYGWDGGTDLELWWGGAAAPLPSIVLRKVGDALWHSAIPSHEGLLEPQPEALLVHLAVQALRPGRSHIVDWEHFLHCLAFVNDTSIARRIAREAGVERALVRALEHAARGGGRPHPDRIFDGPTDVAWRLARAVQSRARPTRLRQILAGVPRLGDTTIRCRTSGVEALATPGVYPPDPDADLFVEMALAHLDGRRSPIAVEVGTGCGAIALALAHRRPDSQVHATDLSVSAIRCSRRNAKRLGLRQVRVYRGSLVDPLPRTLGGRVDILIANLPFHPPSGYVPIGSLPHNTFGGGGADGLSLLRQLAVEARTLMRPGGLILLEMFATQWESLAPELEALGYVASPPRTFSRFAIGPAYWQGIVATGREP